MRENNILIQLLWKFQSKSTFFFTFPVRTIATVFTFDTLLNETPHEIATPVTPVWTFERVRSAGTTCFRDYSNQPLVSHYIT